MSIEDGNPVNAEYTNSELACLDSENTFTDKINLTNNNLESGSNVIDTQKTINNILQILAVIGQGNNGLNVGGAAEVFKDKIANDLRFRTLLGLNSVSVNVNGDVIEIGHPIEFLEFDPVAPVAPSVWFNWTEGAFKFFDGITIFKIGSDYVDLSSNQTIAGEKTFSNDAVFSSDAQVDGKLTVVGDLEVQGTRLIANTTELEVTDSLVTVNKNGTDTSAIGSGFEVERPSGNACIVFNPSTDNKFEVGLATDKKEVQAVVKDTEANILAIVSPSSSVTYYAIDTGCYLKYNAVSSMFDKINNPKLVKGALLTSNGSSDQALPPGTAGQVLVIDTLEPTCLKWVDLSILQAQNYQYTYLREGNGNGSSAGAIRRFQNIQSQIGVGFYTETDDAVNGQSFTILQDCEVSINYSDTSVVDGAPMGVSINSTQLNTGIMAIFSQNILVIANNDVAVNSDAGQCSGTFRVQTGDVIRPHHNGNFTNVGALYTRFSILAKP